VIDEATGATKIDLVRFYDRIAEHILPHLIHRPVALVRAPSGMEGQLFFQKHGDTVKVPGIKLLDRKYWPEHDPMLEIDTREALVAAAQMNMVELHTWNSTTKAIAKPDRMLFDLDPGEGITWEQLVEATELTKRMLDMLELESFLKTSGGKGLHVVVPLTPKDGYDTVKDFSQAVVVHLARTLPNLFVAKSGAQNRIGRIFIDYLRNGNGATTAAAFSARARPGWAFPCRSVERAEGPAERRAVEHLLGSRAAREAARRPVAGLREDAPDHRRGDEALARRYLTSANSKRSPPGPLATRRCPSRVTRPRSPSAESTRLSTSLPAPAHARLVVTSGPTRNWPFSKRHGPLNMLHPV
jgi:DNA ligase D-like protein (predicted polymerase)